MNPGPGAVTAGGLPPAASSWVTLRIVDARHPHLRVIAANWWRIAGHKVWDPATANRAIEAIDHLAEAGPGLGRPMVHRIHGSRLHNLKELRPGSASDRRAASCSSSTRTGSGDPGRWRQGRADRAAGTGMSIPVAEDLNER